ncbi:Gfo/Idh/MocA family oxidoreductase [Parabacteroides goldsteinii]|jgi:alpha-N-acetylgalactosaminidase|uniref:Gfo/Idh/MocA family oxidoreductase n=1 Tax=Parabacteroides goldsteinii TaxID=328812 RepID=UPI0024204272|nr:Gfo/Idh/MocA family oxidoreductase [Parabacteroides goldsteinii]
MINRRHFLKSSLFVGAGTLLGEQTNILNAQTVEVSSVCSEDVPPVRKGKSVMGLCCKPLDVVRIGIIGLRRGGRAVERLSQIEGVEIVAICDLLPERVAASQAVLKKNGRKQAMEYIGEEDWRKICERDDIDLIYNATPWELHVPIALYAMDQGKHAAIEVPAALTVKDCWALVDKSEETQLHCMMLENCCYDFFELATLNMARQGVFGEVIHGEGAYFHELRGEKFLQNYKQWRLNFSIYHTGNPYPTHGLGPIAQILGINQGDRMEYLSSLSTDQYGLHNWAKANLKDDERITASERYKLGDVNTTIIRTVKGKSILIQHDTTSPRPYSRIHMIQGTKGMAVKYPEEKIALEPKPHVFLNETDQKALLDKYAHPLSKYLGEMARKVGGHGGMDYIMDWRLIYCLRNGYPLDQSVYDAAAWSSIVELSERSVVNRSASVSIPDFTRGDWKDTSPWPVIDMKNVLHG